MHKQHLFEARTGGYRVYRIPGLLASAGGVVLATVEARRGGGGDWDANDILLRRSTDGGRTFGEPRVLATCETWGPGPASNLVLIDDPARALHPRGVLPQLLPPLLHQQRRRRRELLAAPRDHEHARGLLQ